MMYQMMNPRDMDDDQVRESQRVGVDDRCVGERRGEFQRSKGHAQIIEGDNYQSDESPMLS